MPNINPVLQRGSRLPVRRSKVSRLSSNSTCKRRTALEEYEDKLKNAFNSSNPAVGFAQQVAVPQEAAGKAVSYGRHLFDIAVSTQAEWAKVAQAQYEQNDKRLKDVLGELSRAAGSAPVVAALNSALSAATAAPIRFAPRPARQSKPRERLRCDQRNGHAWCEANGCRRTGRRGRTRIGCVIA